MGLWAEHFHWKVLLGWVVLGWVVGSLLTVGAIVLVFDQYGIANICFVLVALFVFAKTAQIAITASDPWWHRMLFTFLIFGIIGLGIVETVRGVNAYAKKKALSSVDVGQQAEKRRPDTSVPPNQTPLQSNEDQPGPGPATGMTDSASTVVIPATPKGGAMIGGFKTTGSGEYEVPILHVAPEELSFTPPGRVLRRSELPAKLLVSGHNLTIVRFTEAGFVVNDNGWRDIPIQVALIKTAPHQDGKSKEGHLGINPSVKVEVGHPASQQQPAPPTEAPLPDVALRFVYPKSPSLLLINSPKALARDIKWGVVLWNLDLPERMDPLPIPISTVDWLRSGDKGGPEGLFGGSAVAALLKPGNRLFGSAFVMCPNCERGHTYIVNIVWGEGGWFAEVKDEQRAGHPLIPRNVSKESREAYFRLLESMAPETDRIPIGQWP